MISVVHIKMGTFCDYFVISVCCNEYSNVKNKFVKFYNLYVIYWIQIYIFNWCMLIYDPLRNGKEKNRERERQRGGKRKK